MENFKPVSTTHTVIQVNSHITIAFLLMFNLTDYNYESIEYTKQKWQLVDLNLFINRNIYLYLRHHFYTYQNIVVKKPAFTFKTSPEIPLDSSEAR